MGNLILCRETKACHPYYAVEMGVHLYSGEELSYYIFHNILLIHEDFLDNKLFSFLQELGQSRAADRLARVKDQADMYDGLCFLLQELQYYSPEELKEFRRRVQDLSSMSAANRLKAKGDYLFRQGRYYGAQRAYDRLLNLKERDRQPAELLGRVWYDRASCCAHMEDYSGAMEGFLKAYGHLKELRILEKAASLHFFDPSLELPEELKALISEDKLKEYASNFEERRKLAVYQGKALEAAALQDKPAAERGDGFLALLQNWKEEYRRDQI